MARGDPQASSWLTDPVGADNRDLVPGDESGTWNAAAFGARGDGSTDDRPAIVSAVNAAQRSGGGIVTLPPGTFNVTLNVHPSDPAYRCAIVLPAGVHLRGAGQGATTIRLAASQVGQPSTFAAVVMNANLSGGATDVSVSDLTIDGNNTNQTACHHGIAWVRAQRALCERVTVLNLRGTAGSGSSENFGFEAELSTDVKYVACTARATAGQMSSGFSANGCIGVFYDLCVAQGMTVANGFTHNSCRMVTHQGCWSRQNGAHGFNSEVSDAVTYVGCVSGGKAASASYPYTSGQALGNTEAGWVFNGTTRYTVTGCVAERNGAAGAFLLNNAVGRFEGFTALDNATLAISALSDQVYADTQIVGLTASGNTLGELSSPTLGYHDAPSFRVPPTPSSGSATYVANAGINTATFDGYTLGQVVRALRTAGFLA